MLLQSHGIGESTFLKCEVATVHIVPAAKVTKSLLKQPREEQLRTAYNKTAQAKKRHQSASLLQYKAYHDKQTENEIETYQNKM